MEVAMIENSTPFQREVREWQRVDPTTGALLTGRLEADRWHNGSDNKYGKVNTSFCFTIIEFKKEIKFQFQFRTFE